MKGSVTSGSGECPEVASGPDSVGLEDVSCGPEPEPGWGARKPPSEKCESAKSDPVGLFGQAHVKLCEMKRLCPASPAVEPSCSRFNRTVGAVPHGRLPIPPFKLNPPESLLHGRYQPLSDVRTEAISGCVSIRFSFFKGGGGGRIKLVTAAACHNGVLLHLMTSCVSGAATEETWACFIRQV